MPSSWRTSISNTGLFPRTENLLQKRKPRFSGDCSLHPKHVCLHSSTSKQLLGCCNFLWCVRHPEATEWIGKDKSTGKPWWYPTSSDWEGSQWNRGDHNILCATTIFPYTDVISLTGAAVMQERVHQVLGVVSGNTHKTLTPAATSVSSQLHENPAMWWGKCDSGSWARNKRDCTHKIQN